MLIDYIVLMAIVALSTLLARIFGGGARMTGNSIETVGLLLATIVALLDLGVLPGLTGRTVGKWVTGIRIERSNGAAPGIGRALLRHFIGYPLSFLTMGVGFLLAAFSASGRALHDLIADTVVVREAFSPPPRRLTPNS